MAREVCAQKDLPGLGGEAEVSTDDQGSLSKDGTQEGRAESEAERDRDREWCKPKEKSKKTTIVRERRKNFMVIYQSQALTLDLGNSSAHPPAAVEGC